MSGSRRPRGLIACGLVILAACGDAPPRRGGTVVIGAASDLDHANPLVSVDAWTNQVLRYALFTPLVRYDGEMRLEPALAESWELVDDTAVVFHLRDDLRWHDGTPTTAEDVLFTFQRATDPATAFPNSDYFTHWTGGEALDSFTVRFRFEPHADPLAGWPFTPIVPRHLLDTIPAEALRRAPYNDAPVGNGPFRFLSRQPGDRWVFEANPDYPEGLGGRPRLDRVVWRVIPENASQIAEVRVGEVDLALQPGARQVRELAERDELRLVLKPSRQFTFIVWNGLRPPLDDARVRRALALGIDRAEIVAAFRDGLGEPAVGPVLPFHWAYDGSLAPLPFDPDSARALLAAAGLRDRDGDGFLERPDGGELSLDLDIPASSDYIRDLAEAVRDDLAALGVRVATRPVEMSTLAAALTSPERGFDAAIMGWTGDFRLDLRDLFHSARRDGPYQFASYRNPEVDSLLDRAAVEADRDRAAPAWARIQRVLRDEQPWTVLYYQTDAFLARNRVRGLDMDIRGALVNLPGWWIEPDGAGSPLED